MGEVGDCPVAICRGVRGRGFEGGLMPMREGVRVRALLDRELVNPAVFLMICDTTACSEVPWLKVGAEMATPETPTVTGVTGGGWHSSHTRRGFPSVECGRTARPVEHAPHTRLPHCLQW